jgi:tRNA(Ile)-lysidine synthase
MNVFRGAGIDGLKGIDPVRAFYVRPLLEVTRGEILEYLNDRNIPFRTDSSNLDGSFRRNSIRNSLIPEIREKYNPSVTAALGRLAGIARMENDFLDKVARDALDRLQPMIQIDEFLKYDPAVRNRIIKTALEDLSPVRGGISHEHIIAVMDLITGSNPGATLALPYRISVRREYDCAIISRAERKRKREFQYVVHVPGVLRLTEAGMDFRFVLLDRAPDAINREGMVFMDYSKVVPPLMFRNIKPGDRIQPFGMRGRKKLQDVFTDRKIPRARRLDLPVLADAESVLWVPGVIVSERVRVSGETDSVLSVEKI